MDGHGSWERMTSGSMLSRCARGCSGERMRFEARFAHGLSGIRMRCGCVVMVGPCMLCGTDEVWVNVMVGGLAHRCSAERTVSGWALSNLAHASLEELMRSARTLSWLAHGSSGARMRSAHLGPLLPCGNG